MLWSRYNHLFRSEGRGWLLYNALSNSFLALPEPFGEKFAELCAGDEFRCDDPGVTLQLIAAKAVVDSGEDDRLRDVLRMKRRLADLSERMLLLTVAPTRSCNFACPYCFEANRAGIDMSRETEEQLVRFAERFQPGQLFGVTWFGGEPAVAFRAAPAALRTVSGAGFPPLQRFADHQRLPAGCGQGGAARRTRNPGGADHARRPRGGARPAAHAGLRRRDVPADSGKYRRAVRLRMDRAAAAAGQCRPDQFGGVPPHLRISVRALFRSREAAACLPRLVMRWAGDPDTACLFDVDEAADFQIEQFRRHGVRNHPFYPGRKLFNCIAARRNGYVVGPEGELYKCWNDIGIAERIVGHIDPEKPWNNALLAEWLEGQCALNDPECLSCGLMPVCDGGCPALRREKAPHCSRYRNRLPELLEAHYDATRSGDD